MEELLAWLFVAAGLISFIDTSVTGQQQTFLTTPTDIEVANGQTAILTCHIANQAGPVQWSMNGFLLGYNRSILGFPRYSMVGDALQGIHNLRIENVQPEDEAEFECQVGPVEDNAAIHASGRLTVLLPPTSIEISDRSNNSKVEVQQLDSLSLECVVKGGKPAAHIQWRRNSLLLRADAATTSVQSEEEGRETSTSTLTLTPLPDDNGAKYICEATHIAMAVPLRFAVSLSVLFPPGSPVIEGYRETDTLRMGDSVTLRCVSRGGNPLAQLVWLKDDQVVDYSYTTTNREAINILSIVADASDDGAIYTCQASSVNSPEPMKISVKLRILYAPSKVTISGPTEAKAGDSLTFSCTTERSNPAAEISWVVDGRAVVSASTETEDAKGGWITRAEIIVNITDQERNEKLFSCYATNKALGETVVETTSISILYPPDPPNIFDYIEGTPIRAGSLQRLTCVSLGGNPLPTLKWFKGNKEMPEIQVTSNRNMKSGQLTIIAEENDNEAEYRCEISSAALANPLVASVALVVHFPPADVTIKVKPKKPKDGRAASLVCESGSSNPPATVTWWKGKELLQTNGVGSSIKALHGGTSTKSVLHLNVTADDDGTTYTCQASNEALHQSVHDAVTLSILYKPKFSSSETQTLEVQEGNPVVLDLVARGNPDDITYKWSRDGHEMWNGPLMNLSSVAREDAGEYRCQATNELGSEEVIVVLRVLYQASIQNVTETFVADQDSNPQLECKAVGNPLSDDMITWRREGFDMSRTKVSVANGRSVLTVQNVRKEDSGEFECVADNKVGQADVKKSILVVKHQPVIDLSSEYTKVVSHRKVTARLVCRAEGVPDVQFKWSREGVVIGDSNEEKLKQEVIQIKPILWEGILQVKDVESTDFGDYDCVARNDIGFDTAKITLEASTNPDPPVAIRILNISHDAVLLHWNPGFDGGHNQTYRIRYHREEDPVFMYVDVHPPHVTSTWIMGLNPNTRYSFSAMAVNEMGTSDYTTDIVKAITLGHPTDTPNVVVIKNNENAHHALPHLLVIIVSLACSVLLIFNVILLCCFCTKKQKSVKDLKTSSSASKSSFPTSDVITLSEYSSTFTTQSSLSVSSDDSSTSDKHSDSYSEGEDSPQEYSANYNCVAKMHILSNANKVQEETRLEVGL